MKLFNSHIQLMYNNISLYLPLFIVALNNCLLYFLINLQNENPAFDWNNQTEKPALNVNTIFKDFVVSVIFAPAIIFQSIVVCGHALELNCVNDLSVNLTLNDVDLLNKLRLSFMNVFGYVEFRFNGYFEFFQLLSLILFNLFHFRISCAQPPNGKRQMLPQLNSPHLINKSTVDQFDNHLSDSGFKSNFNPEKSKSSEKSNVQKKYIPYAWSFVGGLFSMQLYDKNVCIFSWLGFWMSIFCNLSRMILNPTFTFSGMSTNPYQCSRLK